MWVLEYLDYLLVKVVIVVELLVLEEIGYGYRDQARGKPWILLPPVVLLLNASCWYFGVDC